MKLIVERTGGTLYVYRESEKHHKAVQENREHGRNGGNRLDPSVLDDDCDISNISGDFYMVFDIKKDKKNKRAK